MKRDNLALLTSDCFVFPLRHIFGFCSFSLFLAGKTVSSVRWKMSGKKASHLFTWSTSFWWQKITSLVRFVRFFHRSLDEQLQYEYLAETIFQIWVTIPTDELFLFFDPVGNKNIEQYEVFPANRDFSSPDRKNTDGFLATSSVNGTLF